MSAHVDCPLCVRGKDPGFEGEVRVMTKSDLFDSWRYLGITVRVSHATRGRVIPERMRCPLCYGAARVAPDLAAAYLLKYGDTEAEYSDLQVLRKQFKKPKSGGAE